MMTASPIRLAPGMGAMMPDHLAPADLARAVARASVMPVPVFRLGAGLLPQPKRLERFTLRDCDGAAIYF